jgi:hypothetical protein
MNKISSQALHVNYAQTFPLKGGWPSLIISLCEASGATRESGMGETRERAPTEAVGCTIVRGRRLSRKLWFKSLRLLHGFMGQCSHVAVPARDHPYLWREFIK